ncbi:MAG TPA: hypothetical protein VFP39_00165 [Gemmatimonadales bacterium]|nr:hypothetical protein [Gemmatimonadales bacterium]
MSRLRERWLCVILPIVPWPAHAQAGFSAGARAAVLTHRLDDSAGRSRAEGLVSGVVLELRLERGAEFALTATTGSLDGSGQPSDDRDLTEVSARAGVRVASWLVLDAGAARRSYRTPQGRQLWTIGSVGAEVHVPFVGTAAHALLRGALLPLVSVNGLPRPTLALQTAAGVSYRFGVLSASLRYELERVDFPARTTPRRLEQLSGVAVGLSIGLSGVDR